MSDIATKKSKTRTITLTDRRPVQIKDDEWLVIAEAYGDSWAKHPGDSRYQQAQQQGELDEYIIKVRQHADGRSIVYAIFNARTFTVSPQPDRRAGYLLPENRNLANYIKTVGELCNLPEHIISECIADLPPEQI